MGTGAGARLTTWSGSRTAIGGAIETVIEGKPEAVRLALTVLLAEGHLLIEDVPGVGKTMLAKALARSTTARCGASSSRRTCCPATSPG